MPAEMYAARAFGFWAKELSVDYLELVAVGLLGWFLYSHQSNVSRIVALLERQVLQHRNYAEELEKQVLHLRSELKELEQELVTSLRVRIIPSIEGIETKVEALEEDVTSAASYLKKIKEDLSDEIKLRWG